MENQTELFLKELDEIYSMDLGAAVKYRVKELILDYLGVTVAGAKYNCEKLKEYFNFITPGAGKYTIIGTGLKADLKDAVFLNGLNAHALDLDDGTNAGIIHIGSPIFSLLLPLLQNGNIDKKQLFNAIVVGYETSFTLANSIQPGHKLKGFHATGTCGVVGAAMAVAYAMGFSSEEKRNAFAAACSAASGMLMVLDRGSELKPYNVAKAALLALTAIQIAKAGFNGPDNPLAMDRGYFEMMAGTKTIKMAPTRMNGTFAVEKVYTKSYAACRYCHPAIECAIRLNEELRIGECGIDDIESILVRTYSLAVKGHDHNIIPNVASAKMSIPYGVAVGLVKGNAGLMEYSRATLENEKIKILLSKITVIADMEMSNSFPADQRASVSLTVKNKVFDYAVTYPKGEPENPLSEREFYNRFAELCEYGDIDRNTINILYEGIVNDLKDLPIILNNL